MNGYIVVPKIVASRGASAYLKMLNQRSSSPTQIQLAERMVRAFEITNQDEVQIDITSTLIDHMLKVT